MPKDFDRRILEIDASHRIIFDDFRNVRLDKKVDLIFTDPPFGINILTARDGQVGKAGVYDTEFDDSSSMYLDLLTTVVPDFVRVLKPGSCIYMFFGISREIRF